MCCADSLTLSDEQLSKQFGRFKFDIIMGKTTIPESTMAGKIKINLSGGTIVK
jgi:hypothetical protein